MKEERENEPAYEFKESENQVIRGLASAMYFVGVVLIIVGILTVVGGLAKLGEASKARDIPAPLEGLSWILQGILYSTIGIMTRSASQYFSQIVQSKGNDINNLMQALERLRGMYSLQRVLILIAFSLLVLVFVFALLFRPH